MSMTHWKKLSLPIILGIVAGYLNYEALNTRLTPQELIGVNRKIPRGERITEADLVRVEVSPSPGNQRHFWLWKDRYQLIGGTTAAVELRTGELIPKDIFFRESKPRFLIPDGRTVICVELGDSAIRPQHRFQLRPQQPISVLLKHRDRALSDVKLAFIERAKSDSDLEGSRNNAPAQYQVGLEIPNDAELAGQILREGISSIESMQD